MIIGINTENDDAYTNYVPFVMTTLAMLSPSETIKINDLFVKNNYLLHTLMVISLLVVIVGLFLFSDSYITSSIVLFVFFLLQLSMYKILYILTVVSIKYKSQSLAMMKVSEELVTICDMNDTALRIRFEDKYMLLRGEWETEKHKDIIRRGPASSI